MKKSILALSLAGALVFSSCESEVVVDDATIQSIVNQAVAAVLAQFPDVPSTQAIADAAAKAAEEAVAAGFAGQDVDAAIEAALNAAQALTNPPVERVGSGGVVEITGNTTWTSDKIWLMDGKVIVQDGATLTIEAGTIVKAASGQGANATVLLIAKGGKIEAVGTSAKPIIFTDVEDDIVYANGTTSPNRSATDRGKWGSVIILGNAKVGEDGGEEDIEGIVSGYDFTKYGGSDDADDSGELNYVSIRHTGTQIGGGDELQGLTMGGVGSGTVIENIELLGSNDDGIEIFGGSVNVTNLMIANHKDDGIDLDEAYKGTITNAVVYMAADSDTVFEHDGTEDSTGTIDGAFTVSGVTAYGNGNAEKTATLGDWKSDATAFIENVAYVSFPAGSTFKGIDADTYKGAGTASALGELSFKDIVVVTSDTKTAVLNGLLADETSATWLTIATSKSASAGADESVFAWTQVQ
mgnify:CR=1 FL=1